MRIGRIQKAIFILFFLYIIYIVVCGVVPPLFHKKADVKESFLNESSVGTKERVLCIDDNMDAFIWRLRLIGAAQEEIVLSTFDFREDNSGKNIMAALHHAAERGVKVKVLADGFPGTFYLSQSRLFHALASHPNIEIQIYNPINLLTPWKINYRMHDKYLIADDTFYILGGRNTNDLFLGEYQEKYNVDRDVLVCAGGNGSSIGTLKKYFTEIWALPCNKRLVYQREHYRAEEEKLREYYGKLSEDYSEAFREVDVQSETLEAKSIVLLSNPTKPENKEPELWAQLCQLVKQGKQIVIETPYIVCDKAMYQNLTELCEGGRQVQIVVNAAENGANPFGCMDYLNQKENILRTGSEIFELLNGQSLHTKTILIDDTVSVIGSYNLDMRSTYIDTELMLMIDCPELNMMLREKVVSEMDMSRHIMPDKTEKSGIHVQAAELPWMRRMCSSVLRVALIPFRHLL